MTTELATFRVRVPEAVVGDVSAELSRRGAWLDRLDNERGVCIVTARASPDELAGFKAWLETFTHGAGQLETVSS